MSAKIILSLLQKISTKKETVHKIGLKYCREHLDFYHQVENYVFLKGSFATELKKLSEFNRLREHIKAIESSEEIIDEMFELEEDISRLRSYVNKGLLVPAEDIEGSTASIIDEASEFLKYAEKYIFIASNEKIVLSQRFEFFRIQSIIAKCKEKEPTDDDIRKISMELNKLKKYINDGSAVSFDKLEAEISRLDSIVDMLDKIDKKLYTEADYPKISLLKSIFEKEHQIEKRANAFYKFVGKDIPKLLCAVRNNCNKIELKPDIRLNDEKDRLTKLRDKEIFDVETDYLRSKSKGIFSFGKAGLSNAQRKQKVRKIKEKYASEWKNTEKNINNIISDEKAMIASSLKLADDIEKYLNENISGLKLSHR